MATFEASAGRWRIPSTLSRHDEPASGSLCCPAIVVSQQAAEPLSAGNLATVTTDFVAGLNNPVAQSLMVSFGVVVVIDVLANGPAKHAFAKEDQAIETLAAQ
jgi:hypothetical protein